jgi:hypothetical protein
MSLNARRKFWEAAITKGPIAREGLARIGRIFELDRSWRKKKPDESLGGLEVAAAQEKDQLIARRAQARGDVLERRGKVEAAFAFDAIENRRQVEHLALDAVEDLHARHGRLPVLKV